MSMKQAKLQTAVSICQFLCPGMTLYEVVKVLQQNTWIDDRKFM